MNYKIIDKDIDMYQASADQARMNACNAIGGSKLESLYMDQIKIAERIVANMMLLDASYGLEVILKRREAA